MIERLFLVDSFKNHVNTEHDTYNGHRDELACVMDEPGEVEAELLTIVLFDEVNRLHIVEEFASNHTPRQTPPVLKP